MSHDACNECSVKGNLKACESTPCSKHDSWYAKQLQEKITKLSLEVEALHTTTSTLAKGYFPEGK